MPTHMPIAVLISGGGTTLRNLLQRIAQGRLDAQVKLVISSSSQAGGLRFAAEAGVPARVIRPRITLVRKPSARPFSVRVAKPAWRWSCWGGFLKHVLVPSDFENRVMNIHPGLIPGFCGKGFYGHHVHQAVLDFGAKVSGCTVHFVDNEYDHGRSSCSAPCPCWTATRPIPWPPVSSNRNARRTRRPSSGSPTAG